MATLEISGNPFHCLANERVQIGGKNSLGRFTNGVPPKELQGTEEKSGNCRDG